MIRLALALTLLASLLLVPRASAPRCGLRWPLGAGTSAYPVGTTYGQLIPNKLGGLVLGDLHYGVDILRIAETEYVFAIERGVVCGIDCTDPQKAGLLIRSAADPNLGLLYLHLDPGSIQVAAQDEVEIGDCLGKVVKWETAADFDHLHLARLAGFSCEPPYELPMDDEGNPTSAKLSVCDPLSQFDRSTFTDTTRPVIEDISFRKMSGPDALWPAEPAGQIDIVVSVSDLHKPELGSGEGRVVGISKVTVLVHDDAGSLLLDRSICMNGPLPPPSGAQEFTHLYSMHPPQNPEVSDDAFFYVVTNGFEACQLHPAKGVIADEAGWWDAPKAKLHVTAIAQDFAGNEAVPVTRIIDPN